MRSPVLVAALVVGGLGVARAASPVVALMPLRDLAGGRSAIGAALRETMTVDLRGTPGVRVVEREAIDRLLREQSIDPQKVLEGVLGVRVGTLLGASHLVVGAYQREGAALRVTVRVVAVETGQIVGSAKVDGELEHMLELEDRVDRALLGSVGWRAPATTPPRRARPRLSAQAIERFGDAVLEPDPDKKKKLLQAVVADSPQFSYAVDALAALEGRIEGYETTSAARYSARERELLIAASEGKAATRAAKIAELLPAMRAQRRYHALAAACDALKDAPPEARELVTFHRFVALAGLKKVDAALAAGEKYLATLPDGAHFAEAMTQLRALADTRRALAQGRIDYDKDLASSRADLASKPRSVEHDIQRDWAPCIAARWNHQYNELMVEGCRGFVGKHGEEDQPDAKEHSRAGRLFVILALGELGRFDDARREVAEFRRRYPLSDEELDKALAQWPTD